MSELKPCPFCGGEAVHSGVEKLKDGTTILASTRGLRWTVHWIKCSDKSCPGRLHYGTEAEAIAAWNHRADLAALEAERDRLREALGRIEHCAGSHTVAIGYPEPCGWSDIYETARRALNKETTR
jgi:hypothetical protein